MDATKDSQVAVDMAKDGRLASWTPTTALRGANCFFPCNKCLRGLVGNKGIYSLHNPYIIYSLIPY